MASLALYRTRFNHLKDQGFSPINVLDVGAYKGKWSEEFKKYFPESKICMIEANRDHISELKSINEELYINLLSDKEKEVIYHKAKGDNSMGNSIYKEQTQYFFNSESVKLKTTTLDTLLPERHFDYIKIDVQGSELDVLKGGVKIAQTAEFIQLEVKILEYNEGSPTMLDVLTYMNNIGFVPYDLLEIHYIPTYHCNEIDILFVKKDSPYLMRGILC